MFLTVPDRRRGVNDTYPTISANRGAGTDDVGAGTVCGRDRQERTNVDVRIGVTQAPRELTVEMPDDERDETVNAIETAMSGGSDVLWLVDKRGRRIGVPVAKIAYVEVGTADGDRRIGFGG
jgi:Protein of unknown function (DUF3107)